MKILCIFREGHESNWLLGQLQKEEPGLKIILETGRTAKRNKLKRLFFSKPVVLWPVLVMDLLALQIYNFLWTRYFTRRFSVKNLNYPFTVDDVNDVKCLNEIKRINPNILLIFGTAIIKEKLLLQSKIPIFNIHTGILPKYRNVHSEFWAYKNGDYTNIGVTIIHLDAGIDSGAIAIQKTIKFEKGDTLFEVMAKNMSLTARLAVELIKLTKTKKVPKVKQDPSKSGFYKTPKLRDLLANLFKIP